MTSMPDPRYPRLSIQPLAGPAGTFRHEHMVRRFSVDHDLIGALRGGAVDRTQAAWIVEQVCTELAVPAPEVTFHGRRGPHTGYCQMPRSRAVQRSEHAAVERWEAAKRRRWPASGLLRFGDPTSLGTVAHELGHHLVNHLDPAATPSHGKRWVNRFDQAAALVWTITRR